MELRLEKRFATLLFAGLLSAAMTPGVTAQIVEAPVCESLVRDTAQGTLTVTYSKNEPTCAHLKTDLLQLTHVANFFCAAGTSVAITRPLTDFGAAAGAAGELSDSLQLCRGNAPNLCAPCGPIQEVEQDSDNDGVLDDDDLCQDTALPEVTIPTARQGIKRHIDVDGDGILEIVHPKSKELVDGTWSVEDTRGCTCEQILETCRTYGSGHVKYGCSGSVIDTWVNRLGASQDGRCE